MERYYRKVIRTFKRVGEPTTIHWHGILQKKVLIQDGVPNVTQQAIPRDSVYRYKFIADNSGTLFYHSHFGEQRAFGLAGPLIIREAKDPNAHLYDYDLTEHIVFIQDFGYDFQPDEPDTMLINGKGIQQTGNAGEPHIFEVEPYKRYRFRMVFNGIINMKVTVWIRDLKMKVIALDGHAIEARDISSFMLASGERLDVVVSFGKERKQPYWLHAKGAGRSSVGQIAMIKFKEMPTKSWTLQEFQNMNIPQGIQLAETAFATVDSKESAISAHKMFAIEKIPLNLRAPKCKYVFLEQAVGTQGFQINQITMKFPNVAYQNQVFSQTAYLDQENFCSIDQLGKNRCLNETCNCEQVIKVSMNTCYDVVILGAHPFHLHGHIFYIVAEGTLPANVTITKELVSTLTNIYKYLYSFLI